MLRGSDPEHHCAGNRSEKNHSPSADLDAYDDGRQDHQEQRHAGSIALFRMGGGA